MTILRVGQLLLGAGAAYGAEPWPLEFFTSDPRAVLETAGKVIAPANADVIVIDTQLRLRVDEQGHTSNVQRSVSRVITDGGITLFSQISQVKMTWRKDEVRMRARVITPDGQAHLLDPRTITEAGIPAQLQGVYTDLKQMVAPLPAVAKGSVIELEIEMTAQEVLDPAGSGAGSFGSGSRSRQDIDGSGTGGSSSSSGSGGASGSGSGKGGGGNGYGGSCGVPIILIVSLCLGLRASFEGHFTEPAALPAAAPPQRALEACWKQGTSH